MADLRPCPFCGVAPWHRTLIRQVSCDNMECVLGAVRLPLEAWNTVADKCRSNDALAARVAELEERLRCQDLRVEELRSANDKWRSYFTTTKEDPDEPS